MHTPSLRRRVTRSGIAVFLLLVLLLDVFIYVTLRAQLEATLDEVVAARAELVEELGELYAPQELADRLGQRGVPAVITTADGERIGTEALPRFESRPPTDPDEPDVRRIATTVDLPDGAEAELFVSRGGVDGTLRRFVLIALLGTVLAAVAALLLLRRAAETAIAPLDQVVEAARRTAAGHAGERLGPDDPGTELGRFATAYDAMLDSLEDALADTRRTEERTRRFLDDAAHQLRTPLATIRASVEALLREDEPEVRDLLMASLVREVVRADRLLTSLLTLARLDSDAPRRLAPTDLVALCRDEVERCRSIAPHLTVELHTPAGSPEPTLEDDAIREVVANLLDNARRHAASRIDVAVATTPDGVIELRVADDGPGIAEDVAERVFQRFTSLDGRGGSGLGLPIARAIVERHGGSLVYAEDAFVLRLPDGGGRS